MVLFTQRRKKVGLGAPSHLTTKLKFAEDVKYLDDTTDSSRLTQNSHIMNRVKRAYTSYEQCRQTIRRSWFLSPKVARWIYTAILRPMLSAVNWRSKIYQTTTIHKLIQIQRTAYLLITGATKSSPTKTFSQSFKHTVISS